MRRSELLTCLLAIVFLAACQRTEIPVAGPEYTVEFTANTESESSSRANVGVNASGRIQTFWEDGDIISVYSSGNNTDGSTSNKVLYPFSTSLASPSTSARFGYEGDDFVEGCYIAIYPHTAGSARAVNFQAKELSSADTRLVYSMARMDVPAEQKLVAGGFDRTAAVAMAYSEDLSVLDFKNAVALVRFKVKDAGVMSGSLEALGSKISGRYRGDILQEDHTPLLTQYNSGTPYSKITFACEDNKPLAAGVDYYVAVRPTILQNGFTVSLNDSHVKSFPLDEFKRNVIYDLGTLELPEDDRNPASLTLSFDFTTDANLIGDWPRTDYWQSTAGNKECVYSLKGKNYSFLLTDCSNATSARVYWEPNGYIVLKAQYRYLGFPIIEGYRLVGVRCLHATVANGKGRGVAVTTNIVNSTATPDYVSGGEPKITTSAGDYISFDLEGTLAGTRYYLNCSKTGIGFSNITLVYEKDGVEEVPPTARVGVYNLRCIVSSETDENNLWENRKTRVVQSIRDNDFDVFGVNECSEGIKSYLNEELSSVYAGSYFNPYSTTGVADSKKIESVGVLYKREVWALSDWHYFWLAEDVDKVSVKPEYNDYSGTSKYCRGGACCVMTHKVNGKKMFFMVTHGCLDDESSEKYAPVFAQVEKKYNPQGYPSFFVGDMNVQPTAPTTKEYLKYWKDSYRETPADMIEGPFSTFNGFVLDRDLNADPRRIDYVYYRNATPVRYVCNDKKYDGYYASDHLPVYVDMNF